MSSITQQSPVRLFVAHAFEPNNDYSRVFEYLENSRNFYYRNSSVLDVAPGLDRDALRAELRKQINLAEVVLIPAGLFREQPEWADFQLNCAKGFSKPVVGIKPFGGQDRVAVQLEALADELVEWSDREIIDAIRRQARHEDTTRWDVIDFKLD